MPKKDEKQYFSVIFSGICSTVNSSFSTDVSLLLSRGSWRYFSCRLHVNTVFEIFFTHSVLHWRQRRLTSSRFALRWRRRKRLRKRRGRASLRQRGASISPSVRGEDGSLPWLISRLIWQDMFDLIKAFGRKPMPDVKNGSSFSSNQELNYPTWTASLLLPPSSGLSHVCAAQRAHNNVCDTGFGRERGLIKSARKKKENKTK